MAFDSLSEKLQNVFKNLRSKGRLTEDDVKAALKEVKMALLEADVNFKVVKGFIKDVQERAVGQDVMNGLNPGQMVIKIVNEELVKLMGSETTEIKLQPGSAITVIMMAGLQGAGKTTTTAKLAGKFKLKGKKPLLVACDVYRPAAIKQLEINAEKQGVEMFSMGDKNKPADIAKAAVEHAAKNGNNIVILDTAGRLHVDEDMMAELQETLDKAKKFLADENEWKSLPPLLRYDVWIQLCAFSYFESFSKHRAHIHLYHVGYSDECKDRLIQETRHRIRQAKKSGLPPDDEDLLLSDLFRQGSRTFESSTCPSQVTPGSLLDEDNGYFAILSSQFKDPTEAMIACELRYTTENFFSDLQNDEDCYRLDVYTPHNLYVRVFVQFVAQILRSYLRWVINQNQEKLSWGQPAHAVLWEIDSLQQVETVDGRRFYRDVTPMQEQILDMFGINIRKSR